MLKRCVFTCILKFAIHIYEKSTHSVTNYKVFVNLVRVIFVAAMKYSHTHLSYLELCFQRVALKAFITEMEKWVYVSGLVRTWCISYHTKAERLPLEWGCWPAVRKKSSFQCVCSNPAMWDKLLYVSMRTAACLQSVCSYWMCLRSLVSASPPVLCVHPPTVCCLKETELIANDIWQRPSVTVVWYTLWVVDAYLIDQICPYIKHRNMPTCRDLFLLFKVQVKEFNETGAAAAKLYLERNMNFDWWLSYRLFLSWLNPSFV